MKKFKELGLNYAWQDTNLKEFNERFRLHKENIASNDSTEGKVVASSCKKGQKKPSASK